MRSTQHVLRSAALILSLLCLVALTACAAHSLPDSPMPPMWKETPHHVAEQCYQRGTPVHRCDNIYPPAYWRWDSSLYPARWQANSLNVPEAVQQRDREEFLRQVESAYADLVVRDPIGYPGPSPYATSRFLNSLPPRLPRPHSSSEDPRPPPQFRSKEEILRCTPLDPHAADCRGFNRLPGTEVPDERRPLNWEDLYDYGGDGQYNGGSR